jgi:hypothetical protein
VSRRLGRRISKETRFMELTGKRKPRGKQVRCRHAEGM